MVIDFYGSLFSSSGILGCLDILDAIDVSLYGDCVDILTAPFTSEEVVGAFKQMHPYKAPGPYVFSALFFRNTGTLWERR